MPLYIICLLIYCLPQLAWLTVNMSSATWALWSQQSPSNHLNLLIEERAINSTKLGRLLFRNSFPSFPLIYSKWIYFKLFELFMLATFLAFKQHQIFSWNILSWGSLFDDAYYDRLLFSKTQITVFSFKFHSFGGFTKQHRNKVMSNENSKAIQLLITWDRVCTLQSKCCVCVFASFGIELHAVFCISLSSQFSLSGRVFVLKWLRGRFPCSWDFLPRHWTSHCPAEI